MSDEAREEFERAFAEFADAVQARSDRLSRLEDRVRVLEARIEAMETLPKLRRVVCPRCGYATATFKDTVPQCGYCGIELDAGTMTWLLAILFAALGVMQPAQRLDPVPKMVITDVVRGGQAEIDQGLIVLIAGCFPDEDCGTWLAGHRTTHGGVFRQVAELNPEDHVVVMGHRYVVQGRMVVCCVGERYSVSADLILQTSEHSGRVWIITAKEIA